MPNQNQNPIQITQNNYDPRWFIWTIVFLLVTGISLVSYIMLSDAGGGVDLSVSVHHKTAAQAVVKK
jgi:hypothetical protein